MKRFVVFLSCLMLLSAIAIPAFAAAGKVELSASKTTLNPGDTFTVTANLSGADATRLCTVALLYDENAFEMTGGTCDVEGIRIGQVVTDKKAGTLMFMIAKKISGKVFTFELRVKSDAPGGKMPITAKATVGSSRGENIETTGVDIQINGKIPEITHPVSDNQPTIPIEGSVVVTTPVKKPDPVPATEPTQGVAATEPQQTGTATEPSASVEATDSAADPTVTTSETNTEHVEEIPVGTNPTPVVIAVVAGVAVVGAGAVLALKFKKKKED